MLDIQVIDDPAAATVALEQKESNKGNKRFSRVRCSGVLLVRPRSQIERSRVMRTRDKSDRWLGNMQLPLVLLPRLLAGDGSSGI